MNWLDAFAERARQFHLLEWEEISDLGLYMDQVITLIERQFRPIYADDRKIITPAMINNYVKSGLIKRPEKKKYGREQLAQLIMLCALKQTVSLEDMRKLLQGDEGDAEMLYRNFRAEIEASTQRFSDALRGIFPMQCAVAGATYQFFCELMLRAEP